MYIKPKKHFGQNFLIDKNIQKKIISACLLRKTDVVLEIGSGRGELTRLIVDKVGKLYALELDEELFDKLREDFKEIKSIEVTNKDILKFNLSACLKESHRKVKVIGNIPYYITTPIIEYLLRFRKELEVIYITVQKEVAQRIVAQSGSKDYGSLSCFLQYYTDPKILFSIKKNCFVPAPKVESCLIKLSPKNKLPLGPRKEKILFKIIRYAFNQRRKILKNSLKGIVSESELRRFFKRYKINPYSRPEELNLNDFINLVNTQIS